MILRCNAIEIYYNQRSTDSFDLLVLCSTQSNVYQKFQIQVGRRP